MRTKTLLATLAPGLLALALNPPCLCAQTDRVQLTLKGTWPGHPLGTAEGRVMVVSNRAYVPIAYAGLAIIDVSSPTNLVPVGGIPTRGSAYVAGHYAYVTTEATWTGSGYAGGDVEILDVSDPARPLRVAGYHSMPAGRGYRTTSQGALGLPCARHNDWSGGGTSPDKSTLETVKFTSPSAPTFSIRVTSAVGSAESGSRKKTTAS